jgi:hypothetical protein
MASKDSPSIEAEIDFNYEDDRKEFSGNPRNATLHASFDDDGQNRVSITFDLGRKQADSITLTFDSEEFVQKLVRAIANGF